MADASASKTAQVLMKKLRQQRNVEAASHFTVGITGIIALYTLYCWIGPLYKRFIIGSKINTVFDKPVEIARKIRRKLIRDVPGFISAGHAVIFILYLIVSLSVLFTNINWTNLSGFAKRLGWLTVLNMGLTIFLGLKHTPLSLITDQTYEKLNCLHQIAGYSSIASVALHTFVYIINLSRLGKLSAVIEEKAQIMGIFAGLSFLIIFLSAVFLKQRYYEAFYVIHIAFVSLALILAGLHRPRVSITKSTYILIFAGSIWIADRLLRLAKYFVFRLKNTATIIPLPHEGTRVVLSKPLKSTAPGQHYFLWLPDIRAFETHPFTCISADSGEFIISAHNGFTRSLYERALREPGAILRASVDGPYGDPPDLRGFTKVLFIAGGSGASFTCSLAVDLVRKLGHSTKTSIDFTLVLKHKAMIDWASSYIKTLASSPIVTLNLHVTCRDSNDSSRNSFTPLSLTYGSHPLDLSNTNSNSSDTEKVMNAFYTVNESPRITDSKEKRTTLITHSYDKTITSLNIGRPNINAQISQAVNTSSTTDRIAIVACGPNTMMVNVRRVVAENIRPEGPSLNLFSEQFGW